MNTDKRHRFSPDIISYAVWLYHRCNLSHRDIEDLLAERGITVSREAIRLWCIKFGAIYTSRLKRKHRGYGDVFYIDEVFVRINGKQHYLWRAVDHEGEVLECFVTKRRNKAAAKKFLIKVMRKHGSPKIITTDKLGSYGAAFREIGIADKQLCGGRSNNRCENSHLPFRRRERAMQKFKSCAMLQKFTSYHAQIYNHFNHERHLESRQTYKQKRSAALIEWFQIYAS